MPAWIVVGTQWGDEGKGKATDLLADEVDYVVRYQGGNNAGHTIIVGGSPSSSEAVGRPGVTLKLHLVPSGVMYPDVTPVIGDGVVLDPGVLLQELDALVEAIACPQVAAAAYEAAIAEGYLWHEFGDSCLLLAD